MPNERENLYQTLTYKDYDIAGATFRAYYDADAKLVFVLDTVINKFKPNVMLVINPVGNRKWDDILANDYGLDLETVRPKKDNKYQKLDVEYTGLAEYDALIQADKMSTVDDAVLEKMMRFYSGALRRAANERLADAELTADKARETIEKTNETINANQVRLKKLRGKLAEYRRGVGKEPTKQSAAKILRAESQIDATNDKLGRAKKRLDNAKHRLAIAEEDADSARQVLAQLEHATADAPMVPATPMSTDVAHFEQPPVPMMPETQFAEIAPIQEPEFEEPKAENMADDEVKPLFDKDPEILDEEIAFKPVDFDLQNEDKMPVVQDVPQYEESGVVAPLSFVPPVQTQPVEPITSPVLDSLTTVDLPSEQLDSELMTTIAPVAAPQEFVSPITDVAPVAADVKPMADVLPSQSPVDAMPEISPAPIDDGMRPVSPITGNVSETLTPVRHKPTVLYYVLLVVLIVLSVFTLWLYQKSANDSVPELGAQTAPIVKDVVVDENQSDSVADDVVSPFVEQIQEQPQIIEPVVVPVSVEEESILVEPEIADVEPEPVPVTPAVPVQMSEDLAPTVSVPATPEISDGSVAEPVVTPVDNTESPFLTDETVAAVPPKPIVDVVVNKPAYNVSQNDKMFVADPEYETDGVVQEEIETCADGMAPDADGCCAGEELVEFDDGALMCCAIGTDECFEPMF